MAYDRICLHGGQPVYISDLVAHGEGDVPSQREWTNVHSLHVEMYLHIEMVWQVRTAILFYSHKTIFLNFLLWKQTLFFRLEGGPVSKA